MGRERNHRSEYSTRKTGTRNTATPNSCSAKSLTMAPTTPIQLCAGLEAGGVDAVFNEGSSGEYDTSARTRRAAKTNTRKPISSLSRRLAVGVKAREAIVMWAFGRVAEPRRLRGLMPAPSSAGTHLRPIRRKRKSAIPGIDRCGLPNERPSGDWGADTPEPSNYPRKVSYYSGKLREQGCRTSLPPLTDEVPDPPKHRHAQYDPVNGEYRETAGADPIHKPGHHAVSDDERNHEPDGKQHPGMSVAGHGANGAGFAVVGPQRLEQVVAGRDHHRRDGEKEREFQRRGAAHPGEFSRRDGGHGARSSREDRREDLAEADPDGLPDGHLLHIFGEFAAREGLVFRALVNCVDNPHDDATDDQGPRHKGQALQVLADDFGKQESRYRRYHEGNQGQRQWVIDNGTIAVFSMRKVVNELDDAVPEIQRQAQDRAQLDDDGEHLPVTIAEVDAQKRLCDAQMCRRADGKKFG